MVSAIPTWNDLFGRVRSTHPALVRAWFSEIAVDRVEHGSIVVRTSNAAQARYLREHCLPALTQAAQCLTGRLVTLLFEMAPSSAETITAVLREQDSAARVLNPRFTFDEFVVDPANQLAHAAALATAEQLGDATNPLFVHASRGMGKTHLLTAIGHVLRNREPECSFRFLSCDAFIDDLVASLESDRLHEFRSEYDRLDFLIVDDVHYLCGRERSQEEFFRVFNSLGRDRKQIVVAADRRPGELIGLEERLVTRFQSGLVALLDRPCSETRMAILRKKATAIGVDVPPKVVAFIAEGWESDLGELERALLRVDAYSRLHARPITIDLAKEALAEENHVRNATDGIGAALPPLHEMDAVCK